MLGSCSVSYALTSEACYKGLPKTATGEIHTFKGWPRLNWVVTEHLSKPTKDWQPPPRLNEEATAYVEYTVDRDGAMKGVAVTRSALVNHCRSLTAACNYTEGEIMVCVLDFKREVGLWHSVLAVNTRVSVRNFKGRKLIISLFSECFEWNARHFYTLLFNEN